VWANQLEVDKRKGAYVAPAAGRVKLGEYAREWLESKHKLKPSTRARYQVVIDTFIAGHAEVALGDISRQLVREWVADLSVDRAPASVHKSVGVLRQVLAMAVRENRLVTNPVDGVELPAVTSVEQRFLTLQQLHTLAAAAGTHRPLVYVLGTCGLRFGEVAELRWRDVDVQKLQIRIARSVTLVDGAFIVGSPKSAYGRTVSLPQFVADLLQQGAHDALVFPDSEGGHMRGSNVRRRWWSHAVAAAELFPRTVGDKVVHEFKLHELRHTAASLAIQAGANIKALQNMLGHESAGLTLDRYGHLYGSDVEAVGVAINALLTRECGQNVGTEPVAATAIVA
jgi:integrase